MRGKINLRRFSVRVPATKGGRRVVIPSDKGSTRRGHLFDVTVHSG